MSGIRITVEDLEGKKGRTVLELENDYYLVVHGRCYLDGVQTYANGTHVLTLKDSGRGKANWIENPDEADGR